MESNIVNMLKEKLQPSMVARIMQMTLEEVTALGKQAGLLQGERALDHWAEADRFLMCYEKKRQYSLAAVSFCAEM